MIIKMKKQGLLEFDASWLPVIDSPSGYLSPSFTIKTKEGFRLFFEYCEPSRLKKRFVIISQLLMKTIPKSLISTVKEPDRECLIISRGGPFFMTKLNNSIGMAIFKKWESENSDLINLAINEIRYDKQDLY